LNRTPEDIVSRCRIGVWPYGVPASAGTYCSARSSTERIAPSDNAMPTSMPTTVLAIENDVIRAWRAVVL
jgi:hypothetical protein